MTSRGDGSEHVKNMLNSMTPEQQRIAIAEFCGWKKHPLKMNPNYWIHHEYEDHARSDNALPNYPKDLNACWLAAGKLTPHQLRVMNDLLKDRAGPDGYTWRLHPAEVSRALLLTIGKWEGGKL